MITDSFHGMCLAIIFYKPFIAIINKGRGATRFFSLLKDLGLETRLVENSKNITKELLTKKMNWNEIALKIKKLQQESFMWLSNSLKTEKKSSLSEYDVLSDRTDKINIKLFQTDNFYKQCFTDINGFAKDVTSKIEALNSYARNVDSLSKDYIARLDSLDNYVRYVELVAKDCVARLDGIDSYTQEMKNFVNEVKLRFEDLDSFLNNLNDYAKSINQHIADLESQNRIQRIIQKIVRKIKNTIHQWKCKK